MNNKNLFKLNWYKALYTLAIGFGAVGYLDTPAIATPIKDNFELAQVGVRSRITPPTPLNIRPRTHTPLPRSNYSRSQRYNNSYGNYRRRDHHHHGDWHHNHHRNTSRGRRKNRGRVIIISPGSRGVYGNYSNNSYIRIIKN